MKLQIPNIVGKVEPVSLDIYQNIISNYVNQVKDLEAVVSIIQIGSFSALGLSDVDIIVVLDEELSLPQWKDISLLELSKDLDGKEVIAHDVFTIPKSIADKAEAYFYIDKQNVLYGKSIGGNLNKVIVDKCKSFLAFDYSIFNIEVLFNVLLSSSIDLRKIALFISTMRHSLVLALDLGIIEQTQKEKRFNEIERFRQSVLHNNFKKEEIERLLSEFLKLLLLTYEAIGIQKLELHNVEPSNLKKLNKNVRTTYLSVKKSDNYLEIFQKWLNKHRNTFFSKYITLIPVPELANRHFQAYLGSSTETAKKLQGIFNTPFLKDVSEENNYIRGLRVEIAYEHWEFIRKTNYKSSGVTFIGFSNPFPIEQSKVKKIVRYIFSQLLFYK